MVIDINYMDSIGNKLIITGNTRNEFSVQVNDSTAVALSLTEMKKIMLLVESMIIASE